MEAAGQEKEMEFPSSLSYTSGRRLECFLVILAAATVSSVFSSKSVPVCVS